MSDNMRKLQRFKESEAKTQMHLKTVQKAAYELIQSDARFLYTLIDIDRNAKNNEGNYIMMCQPYIGLFTDGAEQWCRKIGLGAPTFNNEEKEYYSNLRLGHKLYEMPYSDYLSVLMKKFKESDSHFYSISRHREMILEYYNVGTDFCNGEYTGNTILCALYTPVNTLDSNEIGPWLKKISIVAGKLAAFFNCTNYDPYKYDDSICVIPKDYHFYKNCPIGEKTDLGFLLFSILCSINYSVEFVDKYFVEEIPQKFKFAYLQYYYLCDFIKELNAANETNFFLNDLLKDRAFRNCLAHYGLGQYLTENDLHSDDLLKGLTIKAFGKDYYEAKECLYGYLSELTSQIKERIQLMEK